jgi:molybdate transport system substrate-binding protein
LIQSAALVYDTWAFRVCCLAFGLAAGMAAITTAQRGPTVAAAANLNVALTEIAEQFARDGGARVAVVFGASGTLARQIQDGAPFELFLAADEEFPNQLASAGLTRDAGVVYAVGRLAIFAPNGSPLDVDERLDGLARLVKTGRLTRFAIANPEVAPYGRAAEAVLRTRGLGRRQAAARARRHDRAGGAVRDDRQRRWRPDRVLAGARPWPGRSREARPDR